MQEEMLMISSEEYKLFGIKMSQKEFCISFICCYKYDIQMINMYYYIFSRLNQIWKAQMFIENVKNYNQKS